MPDLARIAADLSCEEGEVKEHGRHVVYKDHLGNDTIGRGRLLSRGLSDREADFLLNNDILGSMADLDRNVPWWRGLSDGPQCALVVMCFQLGWPSLSGFKRMLTALEAKKYAEAKDHALDSKWAKLDTPERAKRVAEGIFPFEVVPHEGRVG